MLPLRMGIVSGLLGINLITSEAHAAVSLLDERENEIVLRCDLPYYTIGNEVIQGEFCASVKADDASMPLVKGVPSLPYYSQNVAIGNTYEVAIEVVDAAYDEIDVKKVIPSKGNLSRAIDPDKEPYTFGEVYSQDRWFPEKEAVLSSPFILRDVRGITVSFYPFRYNPVQGKLRITQSIRVKIKTTGVSHTNVLLNKSETVSPSFENIYATRFINYTAIRTRYPKVADGEKMIVIVPEKFTTVIKPLVDWKNQKGVRTELFVYPKDFSGTGDAAVKQFIQNKYDKDKITYVLLVGEITDVPALLQQDDYGKGPGDPLYTLVSGTDLYADLFVGRFSSSNEADIKTITDKVLAYEKEPDMSGDWYGTAAGMASTEFSINNPGITDIAWQEEMRPVFEKYGYKFVPLYHQSVVLNPDDVTKAVNSGLSWFDYMGHGSATSIQFKMPIPFDWPASKITALTNGNKQPVFISVACNNGSSADTTCFAEAWCNAKSKGGIAFLGSTIAQDWIPPQHAQKEMVTLLCSDEFVSLGGIIYNGKSKMVEAVGAGSAKKTVESWTLYGDPSLLVFSKKPREVKVTCPQNIDAGKEFEVSFDSKIDGRVCIYTEKTGVIDAKIVSGTSLKLNPAAANGEKELLLTVTARNVKPFQAKITVGPTGIYENKNSVRTGYFSLVKESPKVFANALRFRLKSADVTHAEVAVFNLSGARIYTSNTLVPWNLTDNKGTQAAAGIYLAVVTIRYKDGKSDVLRACVGIQN